MTKQNHYKKRRVVNIYEHSYIYSDRLRYSNADFETVLNILKEDGVSTNIQSDRNSSYRKPDPPDEIEIKLFNHLNVPAADHAKTRVVICRRKMIENSRKEIERITKSEHKLISIPKMTFVVPGVLDTNTKYTCNIFYAASKTDYNTICAASVRRRKGANPNSGQSYEYLGRPIELWSKPTTFPRFVVTVENTNYQVIGLGELEPTFQDIENYLKTILSLPLVEVRAVKHPMVLYNLLSWTMPKSVGIMLNKFIEKHTKTTEEEQL